MSHQTVSMHHATGIDLITGAKSDGEKTGGQMEGLEQRHRAWEKGRVYTRSSESSSTSPHAPRRPRAKRFGPLLGSDRHHAAGARTPQSDGQRRAAF